MAEGNGKKLRIGTRGSRLALEQAASVEQALRTAWPGLRTELVILRTRGDQVQDRPLSQVGQKGVFVSEFEAALLEGRIDLAVHSAKDLPVCLAEGLDILAVLPRADAGDVLVLPRKTEGGVPAPGRTDAGGAFCGQNTEKSAEAALQVFASLPPGSVIGTGSLRRQLYGKRLCPQAQFSLIRGNVDSRLKKLRDGGYDGLILAKAGLDRLGIPEREREHFWFLPIPEDVFLPAACQGIIAVEGRCADWERPEEEAAERTADKTAAAVRSVMRLAAGIDDPVTRLAFETERRALFNFGADCSAPAAAYCRILPPEETDRGGLWLKLSVMYAGRECSGTAPAKERLELADRLCREVSSSREVRKKPGKPGKVWLVGAGCGGPELITVKGLSLVRSCDVLLYDSLSAKELAELARPECERIHVGKRYGKQAVSQAEINALLIRRAREGKTVVRLKGGDPYVFGRGGEEMLALQEAGIDCEEVPGVSSAFAAPAAAGIPVTHRGLSRSVTVLTASSLTEGMERMTEADYEALVRLSGTLVILMGMHHLEELTARLIGAGMPPSRPAAVVMEGASAEQRWVRAPLEKLPGEAARAGLQAPAVIVIGETAALQLAPMRFPGSGSPYAASSVDPCAALSGNSCAASFGDPCAALPGNSCAASSGNPAGPLTGVRAGVTGTEGFAARLADALRKQGAYPLDLSFLETVPASPPLPEFGDFSWLVFTSPNGVRVFLGKMKQERRDLRTLSGKRIAVIGPGTGRALEQAGLFCDLMPDIHDAAHLGGLLAERMRPGERALLLRAEQGSPALTEELSRKGREFLDHALYGLQEDPDRRAEALRRLREEQPDYLLFGSASGVRSFADALMRDPDGPARKGFGHSPQTGVSLRTGFSPPPDPSALTGFSSRPGSSAWSGPSSRPGPSSRTAGQNRGLPRVGCIGPQCRAAWEEEKKRLRQKFPELPEAFTAEEFSIDGLVRALAADRQTHRLENVTPDAADRTEIRQKRGDE